MTRCRSRSTDSAVMKLPEQTSGGGVELLKTGPEVRMERHDLQTGAEHVILVHHCVRERAAEEDGLPLQNPAGVNRLERKRLIFSCRPCRHCPQILGRGLWGGEPTLRRTGGLPRPRSLDTKQLALPSVVEAFYLACLGSGVLLDGAMKVWDALLSGYPPSTDSAPSSPSPSPAPSRPCERQWE